VLTLWSSDEIGSPDLVLSRESCTACAGQPENLAKLMAAEAKETKAKEAKAKEKEGKEKESASRMKMPSMAPPLTTIMSSPSPSIPSTPRGVSVIGGSTLKLSIDSDIYANNAEWRVFIGDFASICPLKYTLRHSDYFDGYYLRSWILEGSQDGLKWFFEFILLIVLTNPTFLLLFLPTGKFSQKWKTMIR